MKFTSLEESEEDTENCKNIDEKTKYVQETLNISLILEYMFRERSGEGSN